MNNYLGSERIEAVNGRSIYTKGLLNYLDKLDQDVVFFDPPWGGPSYKTKESVSLQLSNLPVQFVVEYLLNHAKAKAVFLKVPLNFELHTFLDKLRKFRITITHVQRFYLLHCYSFENQP